MRTQSSVPRPALASFLLLAACADHDSVSADASPGPIEYDAPPYTPLVLEAEDAVLAGAATVDVGGEFVSGLASPADQITFTLNAKGPTEARLFYRGDAGGSLQWEANGTLVVTDLLVHASPDFSDLGVSLPLVDGLNTITIHRGEDGSALAVDRLEIPTGATAP